jgi:hypothetical protein
MRPRQRSLEGWGGGCRRGPPSPPSWSRPPRPIASPFCLLTLVEPRALPLLWVDSGCSRCGRATVAWGRRLPLAVPMNERLLVAVGHPKPAVPLSANTCHSVGCLNVREWSRPAVRGKRSGYRCSGWNPAVLDRTAGKQEPTCGSGDTETSDRSTSGAGAPAPAARSTVIDGPLMPIRGILEDVGPIPCSLLRLAAIAHIRTEDTARIGQLTPRQSRSAAAHFHSPDTPTTSACTSSP